MNKFHVPDFLFGNNHIRIALHISDTKTIGVTLKVDKRLANNENMSRIEVFSTPGVAHDFFV